MRYISCLRRWAGASLFSLIIPQAVNGAVVPFPVPGSEGFLAIVNSTNPVIATYQGTVAAFSSDLFLFSPGISPTFIFNNQTDLVGTTVNLGSFPLGTELLFQINVINGNKDYYSGFASRNPDEQPHARVQTNWQPGEALIGFEDLFGLANPNFRDFSFSVTSAEGVNPVPLPASMYLLMTGVLMLIVRTRIA